jgi:hypothetical protein
VTGATPLESLNGILVFSANAPFKGVEPHIYNTTLDPGSPCADTFAASSTQNDEGSMSGFPNPFMSDFALHIKSDKEEAVEVKVYTANGYPVETLGHLRTNASHTLGASWPPGVYIVKVVQDGTLTNYRVVKK